MSIEPSKFFGDRIGFDGIVTPQGGVRATYYQKVLNSYFGDRQFQIVTDFLSGGCCLLGIHRPGITEDEKNRHFIL